MTYKHLEDRVRLGGLALGQRLQLLACGVAAYVLSMLLPLPGSWSISVAVTACGLPAAGAVAFAQAEFDVPRVLAAAVRWHRGPKHYAGSQVAVERVNAFGGVSAHDGAPRTCLDVESLWD